MNILLLLKADKCRVKSTMFIVWRYWTKGCHMHCTIIYSSGHGHWNKIYCFMYL